MFKKNNKNNEEVIRMEQTTFIQRHAKKIIIAGGIVVGAGAAYMMYKHGLEIKDITEKFLDKAKKDEIERQALEAALLDTLEDKNTLMEAASEGLFEDAISKVTNKINYRLDRKEVLERALEKYPDDAQTKEAFNKVVEELEMLFARRDKYEMSQAIFEIKDLDK
jgi:hypothetical protein